jgi:hypothetical protein
MNKIKSHENLAPADAQAFMAVSLDLVFFLTLRGSFPEFRPIYGKGKKMSSFLRSKLRPRAV